MNALQIPEEDVAIRSISVSHDGRLLAAANSKVRKYYNNYFEYFFMC